MPLLPTKSRGNQQANLDSQKGLVKSTAGTHRPAKQRLILKLLHPPALSCHCRCQRAPWEGWSSPCATVATADAEGSAGWLCLGLGVHCNVDCDGMCTPPSGSCLLLHLVFAYHQWVLQETYSSSLVNPKCLEHSPESKCTLPSPSGPASGQSGRNRALYLLKLTGVPQISCWHPAGGSGRLAPPEPVSEEALRLPAALTTAG